MRRRIFARRTSLVIGVSAARFESRLPRRFAASSGDSAGSRTCRCRAGDHRRGPAPDCQVTTVVPVGSRLSQVSPFVRTATISTVPNAGPSPMVAVNPLSQSFPPYNGVSGSV